MSYLLYISIISFVYVANIHAIDNQQTKTDGCIWYGECEKGLNCAYRGAARKLEDEAGLKIMQSLCPNIYSNTPSW